MSPAAGGGENFRFGRTKWRHRHEIVTDCNGSHRLPWIARQSAEKDTLGEACYERPLARRHYHRRRHVAGTRCRGCGSRRRAGRSIFFVAAVDSRVKTFVTSQFPQVLPQSFLFRVGILLGISIRMQTRGGPCWSQQSGIGTECMWRRRRRRRLRNRRALKGTRSNTLKETATQKQAAAPPAGINAGGLDGTQKWSRRRAATR